MKYMWTDPFILLIPYYAVHTVLQAVVSAILTIVVIILSTIGTLLSVIFSVLPTILMWGLLVLPVVQALSLPLGMINNWILNGLGVWDWIPPENCDKKGGSPSRPGYYESKSGGKWFLD